MSTTEHPLASLDPRLPPKRSMFVLNEERNVLLSGMIDVMDKHFQQELQLSLSRSAWAQFAHYLGY